MSIRIKHIPVSPEHSPSIRELVGKSAPEVNGESNHTPSSMTRSGDRQPKITELMRVLQFGDSVLPVGAFSFSNGLESAIQHRLVHDMETLRQFVMTATRQSASADAIALLVAHRAACAHDMTGVLRADTALFNRKMNEEMRTMTVRMGKKLGELSNHLIHTPLLMDWLGHVERKETPGTYPVGLGLLFAGLGLPEHDAFAVHQYGTASMILSASLRLMKIHHFDAQTILFEVNASDRSRVRARLECHARRDGDILALARYHGCRACQGAHTNVHELNHRSTDMKKITRIGVGGPVGSGKTAIIEAMTPIFVKMGVKDPDYHQ